MTGSGTQADPYIIYDVDDLQAMEDHLDAYYELANDIDASATIGWNAGAGFVPVGIWPYFTGHLDGKGYTIDSLFVNTPGNDWVGLFATTEGTIIKPVVITNVNLTNVNMTGKECVGGLAGMADEYTTITRCSASGVLEGEDCVGGLVGWGVNSTISYCHSGGTVTSTYHSYSSSGGLIGSATLCSVSHSYSTADVTATGPTAGGTGGLIGQTNGGHAPHLTTVDNCFATGNVAGHHMVGGLIGVTSWYANSITTVSNCYARGQVSGDVTAYSAGGLIGETFASGTSQTTVENCYSTGEVTGGVDTGGLIGYNDRGTVINCFWDTETSGTAISDGGTGKTTAEMRTAATFTDAGWDFEAIWTICSGVNGDYPCLVGVTPSCTLAPPPPLPLPEHSLAQPELLLLLRT